MNTLSHKVQVPPKITHEVKKENDLMNEPSSFTQPGKQKKQKAT
jgi:hypothetical protein